MSLSTKQRLGAVAAVGLAAVILFAQRLGDPGEEIARQDSGASPISISPERSAPSRASIPATSARRRPSRSPGAEASTSTQRTVPSPLEGYLVDDFRTWSSIPADYLAENLLHSSGAVRVAPAGDRSTSIPVTAMLESPPLPLRRPSLAAPAEAGRALPEGTEVQLQLRLSADGKKWTPWATAEQYRRPDGNLALPAAVPSLMPGTLPSAALGYPSPESSAPLLRYRLTITSRSPEELALRDVRIWKRPVP